MLEVRKGGPLVNVGKDLETRRIVKGLNMGHGFNQFLPPGDIYTKAQ
jgi:hypothetical protein